MEDEPSVVEQRVSHLAKLALFAMTNAGQGCRALVVCEDVDQPAMNHGSQFVVQES